MRSNIVNFWIDAAERAVKTAAQAVLLVVYGGELAPGVPENISNFLLDWGVIGHVALVGAVISVLTSLASGGFGRAGSASLVNLEIQPGTGKRVKQAGDE